MLCGHCKKNQATKTYEQIKKGKKTVDYYCLDCYHALFITTGEEKKGSSVCPRCGQTAEEVKKRNLVGCAYCYRAHESTLFPVIVKMQGQQAHTGKSPLGGDTERLSRRCYQLKAVVEKLRDDGRNEDAKARLEQLNALQSGYGEEDFVWRKRPHSFKRS